MGPRSHDLRHRLRVRQRLNRLRQQAASTAKAEDTYADWPSEEDWLERYEHWGQQALSAGEPDFSVALRG